SRQSEPWIAKEVGSPAYDAPREEGRGVAPTTADRPWFEPLVRMLQGPALAFAMMLVRERGIAEEIVQEAFARVWASANTPSAPVEFRRWLYRAISNLATDHFRRQRRFAGIRFWLPAPENPLELVDRWMEDDELAVAAGLAIVVLALAFAFNLLHQTRVAQLKAAGPARQGAAMAADPIRQQVLLFGGFGSDPAKPSAQTWTWDGGGWTLRHPASSPPARVVASMTYDAAR